MQPPRPLRVSLTLDSLGDSDPVNPTPEPRDGQVVISLSNAEALVLFDFLSRFSDTAKLMIEDQAEQRVLWNICCDLERVLAEPFRPEYELLLKNARDAVRDPSDIP